MLARQRHAYILDRVRSDGGVRVADLVRELGVSDMTVRRDLELLNDQGLVEKVHGGATSLSPSALFEPGFSAKSELQRDAKEAIADAAALLVRPGQAIALSAGTTTYAVARRLLDVPQLTVVTNSVPVADVLYHGGRADQTVILTGGVRTPSDALVGPFAVAALRTVNVDLVLMGVHGMDPHAGFTTPNMLEAETDRAMVEAGRRLIVVADHTKWGVIGISSIARLGQADALITDSGIDPEARALLSTQLRDLTVVETGASASASTAPNDPRGGVDADRLEVGSLRSIPGALGAAPHRRYDPLRDEWVLVSAGRTNRPWLGRREAEPPQVRPAYDPGCYLCPGNVRVNGAHNPAYDETFVFTNDFAALQPDGPLDQWRDGLLRAEGQRGTSRVLCFSPRHDLTLSSMPPHDIRTVIDVWVDQTAELGERYRWVQVFENRGAEMGASNPHPHGQIWAGSALPGAGVREDATQRAYLTQTGRRLLLDAAAQEAHGPRVVEESADWLAIVPFWAVWPFETLLVPLRPVSRLPQLDDAARNDLAEMLGRLMRRYDGLFERPFPFSFGWHQAPFGDGPVDHWQLHAHFYPPLLGAQVRKFMVGYELLSESQRDITPEDAAERLRALPAEVGVAS